MFVVFSGRFVDAIRSVPVFRRPEGASVFQRKQTHCLGNVQCNNYWRLFNCFNVSIQCMRCSKHSVKQCLSVFNISRDART